MEVDVSATQDNRSPAVTGDRKPKPPDGPVSEQQTDSHRADLDQPQEKRADRPPDRGAAPPRRSASAWIATHRIASFVLIILLLVVLAASVVWWLDARHN